MILGKYLSPSSAAKYLDVSVHLLQKWRSLGVGVPYMKLGDSPNAPVRYCIDELEEYLNAHRIKVL